MFRYLSFYAEVFVIQLVQNLGFRLLTRQKAFSVIENWPDAHTGQGDKLIFIGRFVDLK